MSIKVTHVVRQYAPSIGGMEDVVQNIVAHQRDQHGHVPTIVTLDRLFTDPVAILPAEETVKGVRVVRLPYAGSSRYPLAPNVLNRLFDADVVHVHGVDFFYDYLAWTKPWHRRPMVASTHGGFFHTAFASTLKKVYLRTVTRTSSLAYDRVIGTSKNDGDIFAGIMPKSKLTVIENGVNVVKYRDLSARQPTPTVIYFGRWSQNKGLPETLAVFRELLSRQPGWRLIIAGREYDHSVADLTALVHMHGIAANVQLAPNPTDAELASLIGEASYYICLSRHEGFGIAPIEAMSAGLTPILSDIPPFRNLVEQSGFGLLLDPANIADAATQITGLHAAAGMGHGARRDEVQRFVQRYSWHHIADRYVDVYDEVLKRKQRDD